MPRDFADSWSAGREESTLESEALDFWSWFHHRLVAKPEPALKAFSSLPGDETQFSIRVLSLCQPACQASASRPIPFQAHGARGLRCGVYRRGDPVGTGDQKRGSRGGRSLAPGTGWSSLPPPLISLIHERHGGEQPQPEGLLGWCGSGEGRSEARGKSPPRLPPAQGT